jgi:hypothetical protein
MMTAVEKLDKAGAARRAANERVEALLPALLNDAFASSANGAHYKSPSKAG